MLISYSLSHRRAHTQPHANMYQSGWSTPDMLSANIRCWCSGLSHWVVSDSLQPQGLWPTRLLCPWDSLGKNTWVGCHALLQALPDPGIEPRPLRSPAMAVGFFTTSATWEAGSKKTRRQRHRASINHVQSPHLSHFQFFLIIYAWMKDFPNHKESACDAGNQSSIPGSGRSSGERNGHPLQYSCLENPMDREAWWATVHPWGHKEWDTISN